MRNVYMIDGEPHLVAEENEEKFLQQHKDSGPVLTHAVRGNQYVKVIVEIPRQTTEEELSHISELGKIWEKSSNSNT